MSLRPKQIAAILWPCVARLALFLVCFYFSSAAITVVNAASTTTTLAVAPSATIAAGTAVTLTATVSNPAAVAVGQVTFCDASAATCTGPAILGSAQLTAGGTAAIKLTLGVGAHRIKAVFRRSAANLGSSSAILTVTVTGNSSYLTRTAIMATGAVGNYTLSSQLIAFGRPAPTGSVSFLDLTNGSSLVAAVPTEPNAAPATMQLLGAPFVPSNTLYESFFPAPGQNPTFGTTTRGVTVGDFNNDGIPDLVTASVDEGLISVFLGNGDGTFAARVTYPGPLASDPSTIAVGDFNGDGIQDLAVSDGFSGVETLSIFLGNGDGTFQPQTPFNAGLNPIDVAAGDFNNDGIADLVTVDNQNNLIDVLIGNGDGTFQAATTFAVGTSPDNVLVGDFDGDGNIDVAVVNNQDNTVSVLLGKGDGTFNPQVTYAVGAGPVRLAMADFNADGFLDLAVTNSTDNSVTLLLNNADGSGNFTVQPATLPAGANPGGIVAGDFNADGFVDLAVTNRNDNTVSILLGKGDGTFAPQVAFPLNAADGPFPIATADFNGDGVSDLAIVNFGGATVNTLNVVLGVEAETLAATNISVAGAGTHNVFARYPGDVVYAGSQSSTVPLTGLIPTTTVLTSSAQSVPSGSPFTFTATVSATSGGTPTGTVSFFEGATLLGTATLNASGVATFTDVLSIGTHTITAQYSGDTTFNRSTSAPITVTVTEETDFVVGPGTTSAFVNPGGKASFIIVVTPVGGPFNNPVALSATGLPAGATASFTPPSPTPGVDGAPSTMIIQMPKTAVLPLPSTRPVSPFAPIIALAGILALWGLAALVRPTLVPQRVAVRILCLLLFAGALIGFSGCNGGFIASAPKTFVITVTGTSGTQSHFTMVTLNLR